MAGNVRLCDRRRGIGRLRTGQPAERGPEHPRRPDRGGRQGPQSLDPRAGRLLPQLHQSRHHLAVRLGAGAAPQQPHRQLAARARARRLQRHQRPAVRARPGAGLRRWRQLGNVGWSYEDVLPYFKRSEDQERGARTPITAPAARSASPTCGWRRTRCATPSSRPARRPASRATTTSTVPSQEGAGYFQLTNRNGRRCSSAVAFLHPVRSRPNLTVITNALVHGLELDGKRATGVRYASNGRHRRRRARRAR